MTMAADIRAHIFRAQEGQLFSSRDFLKYGSRTSVDQTLYRLVRLGVIVRIAQGVYMRETADSWRPSIEELARFKAKILGKELISTSNSAFGSSDDRAESTFICSGISDSSFKYGKHKIKLKAKHRSKSDPIDDDSQTPGSVGESSLGAMPCGALPANKRTLPNLDILFNDPGCHSKSSFEYLEFKSENPKQINKRSQLPNWLSSGYQWLKQIVRPKTNSISVTLPDRADEALSLID